MIFSWNMERATNHSKEILTIGSFRCRPFPYRKEGRGLAWAGQIKAIPPETLSTKDSVLDPLGIFGLELPMGSEIIG